MKPLVLDDAVHRKICDLCAHGDELASQRQFEQAFNFYKEALGLIPKPAEEWEATTWILSAIGDLYFTEGKIDKARIAFEDAVRCPSGLGNPFIHLRLGQCYFESGNTDAAANELTRAYMGAGIEIFQQMDPKYLQFLKSRIQISKS